MRGRKPLPSALTGRDRRAEPTPSAILPRCPAHLSAAARNEWRRLAGPLHKAGVLTVADRAVLAAYCQAWARWVEAEEQLQRTPTLLKTPSGYVQQSPWLSIANKQLELMGRFMAELGLTPSARSRVTALSTAAPEPMIVFRTIYAAEDGKPVGEPRVYEGDLIEADKQE